MNTKALAQVIKAQAKGSTEKDGLIEMGVEASLTIYANLGSETLIVAAVKSIKIMDELVIATTKKSECYAIVAQDIRAMRFGKGESSKRTGLI